MTNPEPSDHRATEAERDGGVISCLPERGRGRAQAAGDAPDRVEAGADGLALAAPQNQPMAGQIVDRDEVREAAQSRVEVTQAVLA